MSLFISSAYAADAAASSGSQTGDNIYSLLMMGMIFLLMYFLLIRPQTQRAKAHRDLISKLQKGDEIITTGGFTGKVVAINDNYIKLAIAEGVEVTLQRAAVSSVLPKGTLKTLLAS